MPTGSTTLRAAFARRETPEMQAMHVVFAETVEARLRQMMEDVKDVEVAARCFVDTGAMYAGQAGMTKEDFLAYAEESFELYKYLTRGFPNGDIRLVLEKIKRIKG